MTKKQTRRQGDEEMGRIGHLITSSPHHLISLRNPSGTS
jgi:hypothetical protein